MKDKFIQHLNKEMLPRIDYKKLGQSYEGDMAYAKEVFDKITACFYKSYGCTSLDELGEKVEFAYVPAIIESQKAGNICIGIITLDLMSSGEHCDSHFLTPYGIYGQFQNKASFAREYCNKLIPYNYFYNVPYENDIHVNEDIPSKISEIFFDEPSAEMTLKM